MNKIIHSIDMQFMHARTQHKLLSERARQVWKLRKEKLAKEKALGGTNASANNP
jgi:hypothetical protein